MNSRNIILFRNRNLVFDPMNSLSRLYSRKSNPNLEKFYKMVVKVDNTTHQNNPLAPVPNWEILKPSGYRFFLPGNNGPGWHDLRSNAHTLLMENKERRTNFKFHAQDCPVLLRQNVSELFPGIDFSYSELSIITLSHKSVSEEKNEDLIKTFVMLAQDISQKLRNSGYWSDFINPFSGLPTVNKYHTRDNIFSTDPKFRSLGFDITVQNNCRIIQNKKKRKFRGNLFTTAPSNTELLRDLLMNEEEDFD